MNWLSYKKTLTIVGICAILAIGVYAILVTVKPALTYAQQQQEQDVSGAKKATEELKGTTIENPIGATKSFPDLIQALTKAIIKIAIPFAVVAIIFAGFKLISASLSGNEKELAAAKSMLGWILAGTAIVVGSAALASAIIDFAKNLGK